MSLEINKLLQFVVLAKETVFIVTKTGSGKSLAYECFPFVRASGLVDLVFLSWQKLAMTSHLLMNVFF